MGNPKPTPTAATELLTAAAAGDPEAAERLLPLVYDQLRAIAQQRMALERRDHTLQATALVHDAYLRLLGDSDLAWNDRAHFFHAAAEAMRRLLIEHARKRGRVKRGGNRRRVFADILDLAEADSEETLALDDAIRRLGETDDQAAAVVRLRFFAGLSVDETALALGVSSRTVDRQWMFARAWLFRAMEEEVKR
jgi:RNA polymerase sigma factor (TIGR02999 family)